MRKQILFLILIDIYFKLDNIARYGLSWLLIWRFDFDA